MAKKSEHLTSKVIIGYVSILLVAIFTVGYIYNLVEKFAEEKGPDNVSREKVYLITNILSLLYESEMYGQMTGAEEDEFVYFNLTLDEVISQLGDLKSLMKDTLQIEKVDLIEELLEQKRINTHLLMEAWTEMGDIYSKSLAKAIKPVDNKVIEQIEVQKAEETKKDTVVVQRKRKGFLKRVAEVFVPEKEDTSIIVQSVSRVQTDSLVNVFNPSDTIAKVIKNIQRNVADQSIKMSQILTERTADLRYNNSVIASQINQILLDIEEEEMQASIQAMLDSQGMLHNASRTIAYISFGLILIVVLSLYLIIRDVYRSRYYRTQLEKAKQYAEDLLYSRERLMLTISHDIRAPLSSIIGYIELLMRFPQEEREKYYLDNMNRSSQHILSLVNDLLDFHRLDSGHMEIQSIPYQVPVLFREIYDSFAPMAAAKGLNFKMNMDPDISDSTFSGDPIRIRQAVGNLLSNAIKFTPEGLVFMSISTEITEEKSQVTIRVRDEGPGIPLGQQQMVFGEFARLKGSEKTEGFGLGLSITQKLILLMGGELSLNCDEGEGCEFKVTLPLKEIPAAEVVSPEESSEETLLKVEHIKCLLVDDDPLQLALSTELIKSLGVIVEPCTNARKAVKMLEENSFDIVVTDIQMPGFDGYKLIKSIRKSKIKSVAEIPVIALSASIAEKKEHYLEAGFNGFLNKPFTVKAFVVLVNEIISKKPLTEKNLNLSSLTAFAKGDKEDSMKIVKTFLEETRKNIALLEEALKNEDQNQAAAISHKIIPVFTLLEASEIVKQLRMVEGKENGLSFAEWKATLSFIITEANEITEQIEEIQQ